MIYEKIRTISTSYSGDRFAVAEFESRIQIWDLNSGLLRILDTDFDFGGKRLSISNDGKYLTIGSYDKNRITTYSIDSGEVVWSRKDLKKCGTVKYIGTEQEFIFVTLEKQATQLLSVETGETVREINRGLEYWENHFNQLSILEKEDTIDLLDTKFETKKSRYKTTFALLDGCFSLDCFMASYSGGPLECLYLSTLETRWKTKFNGHFLKVGFHKKINKVIGVRWDFINGGSKSMSRLNYDTGDIEEDIDLGDLVEFSFLGENKFLLSSRGQLRSTIDRKIIKQFDFENS
jgi:hypothetical protein